MEKVCLVVYLFIIVFIVGTTFSCQDKIEESPTKADERVQQLENELGIELKEITDEDVEQMIYIPYEVLNGMCKSRSGSTTIDYDAYGKWIDFYSYEISIDRFQFVLEDPFIIKLKFVLRHTSSTFWELSTQFRMGEAEGEFAGNTSKNSIGFLENRRIDFVHYYVSMKTSLKFYTTNAGHSYMFSLSLDAKGSLPIGENQDALGFKKSLKLTVGVSVAF